MSTIHHTNAIYISKIKSIKGDNYIVSIDGIKKNLQSDKIRATIPKESLSFNKDLCKTQLEIGDKAFVKIMNKDNGNRINYKIIEVVDTQFSPTRQYKLQIKQNNSSKDKQTVIRKSNKNVTSKISKEGNCFNMLQYSDSESDSNDNQN